MALEYPSTIQNPITFGWERVKHAGQEIGSAPPEEYWHDAGAHGAVVPAVRRIGIADLRNALESGWEDFKANRTDVIFLCILYPVVGLVLARVASGHGLLPLLFPLVSGFALFGPLAAVGLNEMSRRREQGEEVRWQDAFQVLRSPSIGAIAMMGALLVAIFVLWLVVAEGIYLETLGKQLGEVPPAIGPFLTDVVTTSAGWTMIAVGIGIGFLFAVVVLAIGVVSFPLLLDHRVGVDVAISTSLRVLAANPVTMVVWGMIIAGALVAGSIPLLVGLAVVMPVLGHATWHLYRKVIG